MSDVVGVNCNFIVNGTGYLLGEGSYDRDKKRYFSHRVSQIGTLFFTDFGPLFDELKGTIYLYPSMVFRGRAYTYDAYTQMLALETLYNNTNQTFSITTPSLEVFTVRFIDQKVRIPDCMTYITDGNGTHPDCYEIDCQFLKS